MSMLYIMLLSVLLLSTHVFNLQPSTFNLQPQTNIHSIKFKPSLDHFKSPRATSCVSGDSLHLQANRQLPSTMPECSVNPDPGDSEMIWSFSASHLSHEIAQLPAMQSPTDQQLFSAQDTLKYNLQTEQYPFIKGHVVNILVDMCRSRGPPPMPRENQDFDDAVIGFDRFLKGWNEEQGNLGFLCCPARIGKLLDRDYVWVVTQTMVSFEDLALWAMHTMCTYKVYPGFWGRKILTLKGRTQKICQHCHNYSPEVTSPKFSRQLKTAITYITPHNPCLVALHKPKRVLES